MLRQFSCYAKHMGDALASETPGWTNSGFAAQTIREYFELVVPKREEQYFDAHGPQGKGWSGGDLIEFLEQKTKELCATATLVKVEEGVGNGDRRLFLQNITILR